MKFFLVDPGKEKWAYLAGVVLWAARRQLVQAVSSPPGFLEPVHVICFFLTHLFQMRAPDEPGWVVVKKLSNLKWKRVGELRMNKPSPCHKMLFLGSLTVIVQLVSAGKGELAATVTIRNFSPETHNCQRRKHILSKLFRHCSIISSPPVREGAGGEAGFPLGRWFVTGRMWARGQGSAPGTPPEQAVQCPPSPLSRVCTCASGGFGEGFFEF